MVFYREVRAEIPTRHVRQSFRSNQEEGGDRDETRREGIDEDGAAVLWCSSASAMMRCRPRVDSPARNSPQTIHPHYQ
jgi:hypothetical protein